MIVFALKVSLLTILKAERNNNSKKTDWKIDYQIIQTAGGRLFTLRVCFGLLLSYHFYTSCTLGFALINMLRVFLPGRYNRKHH